MATISSHTLNGVDGTHAGGIDVTLINVNSGTTLLSTQMDDQGRLSESIDLSDADPEHRYELTFKPSEYWRRKGIAHESMLDEIVLRFCMPDPKARYHRPLILSPNSYSTWVSVPE